MDEEELKRKQSKQQNNKVIGCRPDDLIPIDVCFYCDEVLTHTETIMVRRKYAKNVRSIRTSIDPA